ncbi:hypothetical protein H5410_040184 [Solanum commersonii]|uniref:Uncharacterized protein n=1 Tax=Solanum commersonii TaxID=4109 RepID=A0A9J5XRR5_SOLCO|nr:hypothetical protein H5410_040184 [Solanum commersonii]
MILNFWLAFDVMNGPPHPQVSNTDERDHYELAKPILLQNERRLVHTSKRGRLFKRKVMKEHIVEVQKKKKIGNHSKV